MIFDFLRRGADESAPDAKASATGPVIAYTGAGRVAWSPRDTVSLTRSGFSGNPVGFRSVKLIAEAAAALPLVLQDCERRYERHPLLGLLRQPNPGQGRAELLEALFAQLLLSGNAYVEAVFGDDHVVPAELHVLRSDRMSVVPGSNGWPAAYEYAVGARKVRFDAGGPVSPICHIKAFHPQDDHYGLSPLQAAAMALDVHNSASRWSKALLDNAARPSGALVFRGGESGDAMSEEQFQRLSDEISANYQGARNAGRPMVLEGGLDWKPMGFSPSDMEFHKTKEAAAREIALAFGVPPMLIGIQGDATYANYQEANRAFYRLTVVPLATRVAAALSVWLGRFAGETLELKPDLDQVSAQFLHEIETALRDVFRDAPLGSLIVPLPEGSADDMENMRHAFRGRRGSTLVIEGVAQATAAGMNPNIGQHPDQLSPHLDKSLADKLLADARGSVWAAFGILPGLMNAATTGPMVREAQRHLAQLTLQPIAGLIAEEATDKLGAAVSLDVVRPMQAFDHGGKARAFGAMLQAYATAKEAGLDGATLEDALAFVDWQED